MIPNKKILGEILANSFTVLVVEDIVGVEYPSDSEQAIECVRNALAKVTGIDPDKSTSRNLDIRP